MGVLPPAEMVSARLRNCCVRQQGSIGLWGPFRRSVACPRLCIFTLDIFLVSRLFCAVCSRIVLAVAARLSGMVYRCKQAKRACSECVELPSIKFR